MRNIDYFDKQARLHPDRIVLVAGDERYTYAEMAALSQRLAGALIADGLKRQEAVAIMSPNHGSVLIAMLGVWRVDAAWIPVNTRNALDANIQYLNYVRASWLFYHSSYAADAHAVARQVPTIRRLICLDAAEGGNASQADYMLSEGSPPVPDGGDPGVAVGGI
jgi:acyl-CoA synthetase (AMP-forming)/AMP-acid ligase II